MNNINNTHRPWTIYLAQDKHLDYNWCGTHTEIETRMAELLDYYIKQSKRSALKWNIDCTLWLEVYRRQRGKKGAKLLLDAIKKGSIGYAANYSVLLWGIMSTELSIRSQYNSIPVQEKTNTKNKLVLVMENMGLHWGIATILSESGFMFLGRGIYPLRGESYCYLRDPYPLFWWVAPNGKRVLVYWPPYDSTRTWGGYAEGFILHKFAGEKWDAFNVQEFGNRNSESVYKKRKEYIIKTVKRYESYGKNYPVSSIMLLGTGHDNWTKTTDLTSFIHKFNKERKSNIKIKEARYDEFFEAVMKELKQNKFTLPTLKGSFGICWDEWAAHIANSTKNFRQAERILRLVEAENALDFIEDREFLNKFEDINRAWNYLLKFSEHDFGGHNRYLAAVSAGVRRDFSTRALSIARVLYSGKISSVKTLKPPLRKEKFDFKWRDKKVKFDPIKYSITSLVDKTGYNWVPQKCGLGIGEFLHTRYKENKKKTVFPTPESTVLKDKNIYTSCSRSKDGVEIITRGYKNNFYLETHWLFYEKNPWIDICYNFRDGWTEDIQSVQLTFPLNIKDPSYIYDMAGAILNAGTTTKGGTDLKGSNTELYSVQTFAAVEGDGRTLLLITPDSYLIHFNTKNIFSSGFHAERVPAQITAMPLMNFTRVDNQVGQGGDNEWSFRYRLVFTDKPFDPLYVLKEAQEFVIPPFLKVGNKNAALAIKKLKINFPGAVIAMKVSEDRKRVVIRLWNILKHESKGSLKLPKGFQKTELCDALERGKKYLPSKNGLVEFTVPPKNILTLAISGAYS